MQKRQLTTDLWFGTYLKVRGIEPADYEVIGRSTKLKLFFDLTDEEWRAHRVAFTHSEFSKFRTEMTRLKDLAY